MSIMHITVKLGKLTWFNVAQNKFNWRRKTIKQIKCITNAIYFFMKIQPNYKRKSSIVRISFSPRIPCIFSDISSLSQWQSSVDMRICHRTSCRCPDGIAGIHAEYEDSRAARPFSTRPTAMWCLPGFHRMQWHRLFGSKCKVWA